MATEYTETTNTLRTEAFLDLQVTGLTPAGKSVLLDPNVITEGDCYISSAGAPNAILTIDVRNSGGSRIDSTVGKIIRVIEFVERTNEALAQLGEDSFLLISKIPGDGIEVHVYGNQSELALLALTACIANEEQISFETRTAIALREDDWNTTVIFPHSDVRTATRSQYPSETFAPSLKKAAVKMSNGADASIRLSQRTVDTLKIIAPPAHLEDGTSFYAPKTMAEVIAATEYGIKVDQIVSMVYESAEQHVGEKTDPIPHSIFLMIQRLIPEVGLKTEAAYLSRLYEILERNKGVIILDRNDPKSISGGIIKAIDNPRKLGELIQDLDTLAEEFDCSVKMGVGPSTHAQITTSQHGNLDILFNMDGSSAAKLKTQKGVYVVSDGLVLPPVCEVEYQVISSPDGKIHQEVAHIGKIDLKNPYYLEPTPENKAHNWNSFYRRNFTYVPLLVGYASLPEFNNLLQAGDFHSLEIALRKFSSSFSASTKGLTSRGLTAMTSLLNRESPGYLGIGGIALLKLIHDNFKFGVTTDVLTTIASQDPTINLDAQTMFSVINSLVEAGQVISVKVEDGKQMIIPHTFDSHGSIELLERQGLVPLLEFSSETLLKTVMELEQTQSNHLQVYQLRTALYKRRKEAGQESEAQTDLVLAQFALLREVQKQYEQGTLNPQLLLSASLNAIFEDTTFSSKEDKMQALITQIYINSQVEPREITLTTLLTSFEDSILSRSEQGPEINLENIHALFANPIFLEMLLRTENSSELSSFYNNLAAEHPLSDMEHSLAEILNNRLSLTGDSRNKVLVIIRTLIDAYSTGRLQENLQNIPLAKAVLLYFDHKSRIKAEGANKEAETDETMKTFAEISNLGSDRAKIISLISLNTLIAEGYDIPDSLPQYELTIARQFRIDPNNPKNKAMLQLIEIGLHVCANDAYAKIRALSNLVQDLFGYDFDKYAEETSNSTTSQPFVPQRASMLIRDVFLYSLESGHIAHMNLVLANLLAVLAFSEGAFLSEQQNHMAHDLQMYIHWTRSYLIALKRNTGLIKDPVSKDAIFNLLQLLSIDNDQQGSLNGDIGLLEKTRNDLIRTWQSTRITRHEVAQMIANDLYPNANEDTRDLIVATIVKNDKSPMQLMEVIKEETSHIPVKVDVFDSIISKLQEFALN